MVTNLNVAHHCLTQNPNALMGVQPLLGNNNKRDKRRGDNFDNDDLVGGEFRPSRRLEHVKL